MGAGDRPEHRRSAFDDIWTLERACQILITAWVKPASR